MLQIDDLVFNAWGRRFFDHASLNLPPTAKAGLVGRNGVGKSTLFKLILGELTPDGGEISWPKGMRIAAVAQEHPATPVSLVDTILEADTERHALMQELEVADPERMGDIYMRLMEIDAYLDLEGALWLEARLRKFPKAALVISHDRELLNNSVDSILHIQQGKLDYYTGGYDDFERRRAEKARLQAAFRAKQDAERAHLQSFVDRFKAKASKAAQAQSRMKRLAKMEPVSALVEERVAPFFLPSPPRPLAPPLMRLEHASVGYGDEPVLKGLNLRLDLDDRIGLLGVNGAGKSTFAKLAAGALGLQAGLMTREKRIKVGWFHQHQIEAMDPRDTPMDIIREARPQDSETSYRSRLAGFGIGFDKQSTTVENLSGGERARLLLNMVAMDAPHLLILDEPTNHLDIDSRRALLDALNDYEGAVILITHDRSLMELVADRLWLAADGTIAPFDGDMDDYAAFVLDRAKGGSAPGQGRATKPKREKLRRAG
jgi:ATP-binding cassette subfamily F protein 3